MALAPRPHSQHPSEIIAAHADRRSQAFLDEPAIYGRVVMAARHASFARRQSVPGEFCKAHSCQAKESTMSRIISLHVRRAVQALIVSLMPALVWAGPVDINTADAATIAKELQGIGLSRAQAIVAYREKNGAFRSVEDLRKIKGIGAKVLERNRANIKVDGASRK
jgi:competence protein ComEA